MAPPIVPAAESGTKHKVNLFMVSKGPILNIWGFHYTWHCRFSAHQTADIESHLSSLFWPQLTSSSWDLLFVSLSSINSIDLKKRSDTQYLGLWLHVTKGRFLARTAPLFDWRQIHEASTEFHYLEICFWKRGARAANVQPLRVAPLLFCLNKRSSGNYLHIVPNFSQYTQSPLFCD